MHLAIHSRAAAGAIRKPNRTAELIVHADASSSLFGDLDGLLAQDSAHCNSRRLFPLLDRLHNRGLPGGPE